MIRATLSILLLAIMASLTACARSAASASVPTTVPSTSTPVTMAMPSPTTSPSPIIAATPTTEATPTVTVADATPTVQPTSGVSIDVIGSGENRTTITAGQTATVPAGNGITGVSTSAGQQTVTLADNGKTIDLQVGQSFLLALGTGYDWSVDLADQSVVSRVVGILVVRGAQGIYKAHQPGHTTLTAVGDPPCRKAQPACGLPSRLFKVDIVVQ